MSALSDALPFDKMRFFRLYTGISELRAYNSTQAAYKRWKEQTLAYYAANTVKCTEPEELDRDELIARRTELLGKEYCKNESNK